VGNGPMVGMEALTAADICARFDANKEALALLREGMAPGEFVQALIAKRQYVNGIDFMAHALLAREGVWWGCLCVQHVCGANLTEPDRAALLAAASWVLWPTEANRAAAQAPAEAAGRASPAGSLAMAANVAGAAGPVPLSPAKAVANAVKLATTKGDPARIADTQRLFVELGMGVAEGRFTWPSG
jgi:hypothetical protein